jgi:hypothetical protein
MPYIIKHEWELEAGYWQCKHCGCQKTILSDLSIEGEGYMYYYYYSSGFCAGTDPDKIKCITRISEQEADKT